ncbi:MAG TPA: hypothetical protein VG184_04135 [Acidimicrobiales bacterium]|nr:hypothetical protein [Acidimicrobiales bacterium]
MTVPTAPPPAAAWVVVDVGTGHVLAAYRDHQLLPPASLTKVLTALVATRWLPAGDSIPVTPAAATVYPDRVGMKAGQVWPLDLAIHSLLIFSANDAAYAIAQRVSGSLASFGGAMDTAAGELGMVDHPVLHDPAGLDGTEGVDGGNLMSARDLAIAGRALLAEPYLAQMVALHHFPFKGPDGIGYDIETKNLAFMLSEPGAIGIKTGFTDRAGSCLMGAATQGGRTLMAVVLNGPNATLSARDLLAQGFAIPAAAEPTADSLPAVVIPHPLPHRAPARTAPESGDGQGALAAASVPARAPATPPLPPSPAGGLPPVWSATAAGAALGVAVTAIAAVGRRRRLTRPRLRPHRH